MSTRRLDRPQWDGSRWKKGRGLEGDHQRRTNRRRQYEEQEEREAKEKEEEEAEADRGGRKRIDKWDVIAGPMRKRKLNTAKPEYWERRDAQQQQGQGAIANLAHFRGGALENAGRTGMC